MNITYDHHHHQQQCLIGQGEVAEKLDLDFYYNNNKSNNKLINTSSNATNNDNHDLQSFINEDDQFFYTENYTTNYDLCFPYYSDNYSLSSSVDPLLSFISPDIIPLDFDNDDVHYSNSTTSYQYPKRQKTYNYNYSSDFTFNNYPSPHFLPELLFPPPTTTTTTEIPISAVPVSSNGGGVVENGNKKSSSGYLSAQSVAARQRRRKISEKTQQLGKLVPGGSKMNTAEMFQAAFKYIKFLQAQVGILQLMGSIQEEKKNLIASSHLEVLLASQTVQEKMYSEEKCLIPREFVEILAKDNEIKAHLPLISKDINSLVPLQI